MLINIEILFFLRTFSKHICIQTRGARLVATCTQRCARLTGTVRVLFLEVLQESTEENRVLARTVERDLAPLKLLQVMAGRRPFHTHLGIDTLQGVPKFFLQTNDLLFDFRQLSTKHGLFVWHCLFVIMVEFIFSETSAGHGAPPRPKPSVSCTPSRARPSRTHGS